MFINESVRAWTVCANRRRERVFEVHLNFESRNNWTTGQQYERATRSSNECKKNRQKVLNYFPTRQINSAVFESFPFCPFIKWQEQHFESRLFFSKETFEWKECHSCVSVCVWWWGLLGFYFIYFIYFVTFLFFLPEPEWMDKRQGLPCEDVHLRVTQC